jgi:hypothetical protein
VVNFFAVTRHQRLVKISVCAVAVMGTVMAMARPRSVTDEALKTVRVYDLMAALPRATLQIHNPTYFRLAEFGVAQQSRRAAFLHPAGHIEFPVVHLSSQPMLSFKIGIDDRVWDKPGDGVQFSVFVNRSNNARTNIYERYVDAKHNADDRRWIEGRISLKAFRNQDVRLAFATGPGPAGDFNYDWALWSEAEILLAEDQSSTDR